MLRQLKSALGRYNTIGGLYKRPYYLNNVNFNNFSSLSDDDLNRRKLNSVLVISDCFNSMSQRMWLELNNYDLDFLEFHSVQNSDDITNLFEKYNKFEDIDMIFCPFLTKKIPNSMFEYCENIGKPIVIVHPGIVGDKGPSSIDWALYNDEKRWGVELIAPHNDMDAGNVYDTTEFDLTRNVSNYHFSKSNMYQKEIINSAINSMRNVIENYESNNKLSTPQDEFSDVKGILRPLMKQEIRQFNWNDNSENIVKKINLSTSQPGSLAEINGEKIFVYNAFIETKLEVDNNKYKPGDIIGTKNESILIATNDKPIWITHMKRKNTKTNKFIKLPALQVLKSINISNIPIIHDVTSYNDIWYEIKDDIVYLYFDFFNGAMSTDQCERLSYFINSNISKLDEKIVILMGGYQYFSNGINLNTIHSSENDELESLDNINAMNHITETLMRLNNKVLIAGIQGNCGAGGVMMPLCCDYVWSHKNIVLNPHYKGMNLYGSEYWTLFLRKKLGNFVNAKLLTDLCLPISSIQGKDIGLIDELYGNNNEEFIELIHKEAIKLSNNKEKLNNILNNKKQYFGKNFDNIMHKHHKLELKKMINNFNSSLYKITRKAFVEKEYVPKSVLNNEFINFKQTLNYIKNNETNNDVIINGDKLSKNIQSNIKNNINNYINKYDRQPRLDIIQVGDLDSSNIYISKKLKLAEKMGINANLHKLVQNVSSLELSGLIDYLNKKDDCDGIILQSPIPKDYQESIGNISKYFNKISPIKDVDGLSTTSFGNLDRMSLNDILDYNNINNNNYNNYVNISCTTLAVQQSLLKGIDQRNNILNKDDSNYKFENKNIVILGRSFIVGRPLLSLLTKYNPIIHFMDIPNYNVTDDIFKDRIEDEVRINIENADIVIACIGQPNYIIGDWIKPGAILIDVGINYIQDENGKNKIVGDIDFNSCKDLCNGITPVPRGIGPLTCTMLMDNVVKAAKVRQLTKENQIADTFMQLPENLYKQKLYQ